MLNIVSTATKSCRARTQLRRAISDKCGEQASGKNTFLPKKNRGKFFINLHEDKLNRNLRMPKDEKQTMSLIFIYLSQMKICTLIISARESERLPADSRVISKAHCAVDCDIYRCCQLETEKDRRRKIQASRNIFFSLQKTKQRNIVA